MENQTKLAGIDLAWRGDNNPTAVAIGSLGSQCLIVNELIPAIHGYHKLLCFIKKVDDLVGIAIDAPLIIKNESGQRPCENEIGKEYGSRKAACHTSNTTLYPNANSVKLSKELSSLGFRHLKGEKWQIECYPHPAIIEIYGLKERLMYKKGKVEQKKAGQIKLGELIRDLSTNCVLKLQLENNICKYINRENIKNLKGKDLKSNEDALDSIICLYIAALYAQGCGNGNCYGNEENGYIWVPKVRCDNKLTIHK